MKRFLLVLLTFTCLTGCTNINDFSKYKIDVDSDENIKVETYVEYDKDYLIVYLTNNNSYNIGSFDVEAVFYDEKGNNIGDDSTMGLDFISGGNYVALIDLPHDDEYNNFVPEKIDLSVKIDQEYQNIVGGGTLYNDKILIDYKRIDDEIQVTLINNSGKELHTVEVTVLFMKNGKPIYTDVLNGYFDIGESNTETIDIPVNWEVSENSDKDVLIDYDSIEFVVNRATAD